MKSEKREIELANFELWQLEAKLTQILMQDWLGAQDWQGAKLAQEHILLAVIACLQELRRMSGRIDELANAIAPNGDEQQHRK